MWLCERKVSIPSAGAGERKWVIKPEKKKPRRRAGASDSGIHLIALKWKRFLASHLLCLKNVKSNPTCIPAKRWLSSSSISTNPSLSVVPSVILLLILRKLLFTVCIRQRRQKFSSFAHILRPMQSQGKVDVNTIFYVDYFISVVVQTLNFCVNFDKYENKRASLPWYIKIMHGTMLMLSSYAM